MIYIDDIGNLENLLLLSNEEYGSPKLVVIVESLLEILTKRRSQAFYKPVSVLSMTNAIGESICSSIRIGNIRNQSDKYDFSCG